MKADIIKKLNATGDIDVVVRYVTQQLNDAIEVYTGAQKKADAEDICVSINEFIANHYPEYSLAIKSEDFIEIIETYAENYCYTPKTIKAEHSINTDKLDISTVDTDKLEAWIQKMEAKGWSK